MPDNRVVRRGWLDPDRMRVLRDSLGNAVTVEDALRTYHAQVTRPLGATCLYLLEHVEGERFDVAATAGLTSGQHRQSDPCVLHIPRQVARAFDTLRTEFLTSFSPVPPLRAALIVPLPGRRGAVGVLTAYWMASPDRTSTFWVEATAPLLAARVGQLVGPESAHARVLAVEDDPDIVRLLELALSAEGYSIRVRRTVAEGIEEALRWGPDLAILDVMLPDGSGQEVAETMRHEGGPRILFLSALDMPLVEMSEGEGYVQKPFHPRDLLQVVEGLLHEETVVPRPTRGAEDLLERYALELAIVSVEERAARASVENAYLQTVEALAAAVEARDLHTGQHLQRVRRIGRSLAEAVAPELLMDRSLEYGFLLHDLGKIGVPDAVLRKPGTLTPQEMELMRSHVTVGEQLVARVPYLDQARRIIACHHERWDGEGYPRGLMGTVIPLGARIFSIADAFDAMVTNRPYRRAMSTDEAREEIRSNAGSQFDPDVVEAFMTLRPDDLIRDLSA